jgi:HK97 family phage major capsid protein
MTLVELRERFITVGHEMGALATKDSRTADDEAQLDKLLAEFNDLGPKVEREQAIEAATKKTELVGSVVQSVASVLPKEARNAAIDPKTGKPFDRRSIGRIVASSDEFQHYRSNPRGKSDPIELGSLLPEHRAQALVEHHEDMTPDELRAVIYGGALAADMVRPQLLGTWYRGLEPIAGVRDVLMNGTTTSDAIIFIRELLFTNAAAGVLEAVSTVTGAKPESSLTFEQATAPVETVAHWIPITRQTLDDVAQMQTYVNGRLLDGLTRTVNGYLLNGTGTAPQIRGILQTSGIQALTSAGEFTTSVVLGPASNANFNRLRRGKRKVRVTGGANPNFIVLNPIDMEAFETVANADGKYLAGDPTSGAQPTRFWGMRVVEDENMASGTALVGDGSMACVWDRMQAQIFVADQHSDFFVRNLFVLLAETRLALTVFRPTAFATVQLATWA